MRSRIPQFVLMAAVLSAAAYGFITNCLFAMTLGDLYVLAAVVTGTIKTVLPVYLEDRSTPNRAGIWFLFFAALTLDIAWGMGYASITRGASTVEAAQALKDYRALEADVTRHEEARKALPAPRAGSDQLKLETDKLKALAGPCRTDRQKGTSDCLKVATAEIEHSKAVTFEKATADEATARERLRTAKRPESAKGDRAAIAVGEAARGLGWDITDVTAGKLLSVLLMVAFEAASVFGFKAALRAPYVHLPVALPTPTEPPRRAPDAPAVPQRQPSQLLAALQRLAAAPAPGLQRTASGGLFFTQRALATALGKSASELNRQLHKLASEGSIILIPGGRGTSLEFAS